MNRDREESDRVRAVRSAALGWRRAGAIDEPALRAILELFPAIRRPFGPVATAVVFVVSSVAVWALFGAVLVLIGIRGSAGFGLFFLIGAAALAAATEALLASEAYAESGAAASAALWAAVFATGGVVAMADPHFGPSFEKVLFGTAAAAFAAAAWRWGWPLFAGASAFSIFLLLAGPDTPRPLIVLFGLLLASASTPFLDRPALPLARRESAHAVLLVSLSCVYVLVNRYSVDARLVEELFGRHGGGTDLPGWRATSAALTALLPIAVLAWGLRSRRRTLLAVGAVMAALSLATLRHYVHVAPAWLVLTASGAALVAGATLLERWLRSGPDRERAGFTAEPLFDDEARQQAIGVVAAAAAFSPAAAPPSAETGSRFTGGGGDSGGGGATESF